MDIKRSTENKSDIEQVGMAGILSNDIFQAYRRCECAQSFCLPDETVSEILRASSAAVPKARLQTAVAEHVQRFKRQSPWIDVITFATPALEVLPSETLSTFGLKLFSLNQLIVAECVKDKIRRPALLGTEWDVAPDSPLTQALADCDIEAQRLGPEKQQMYHLLTACVYNQMKGYISCGGPLKTAQDFCVDVVNRLLYESASTVDAFIICNPELRSFVPRLRQCLKNDNATIPIINASALHLAALSTRTFKNPLS